jgi:TolB-like protein/DNA-binding winged helix-turn-helix (wHTH) protein/Tfp pilus assembly protein PilF
MNAGVNESREAYGFGPFRLDGENRILVCKGQPVSLTPKAFDILLHLVERGGQLVTKDDLMKALWPDTFVAESNLTQTVFMLRKALGETGSDQRYISTVLGRGYRFVGDVRRLPTDRRAGMETTLVGSKPGSAGTGEQVFPPADAVPVKTVSFSRSWLLLAAMGVLVIATVAGYLLTLRRQNRLSQQVNGKTMLAVLPFDNLTGDAGQDYFSDGFTEELITQLGRLDPQHLGVIARTSVMHYTHGQAPIAQIGRELGVQYVLEGSVRRDSGHVRIAAQLIQVQDQTHLWAHAYDRELKNLLGLQEEIAHEIADGIQLPLGHSDAAPAPQPVRPPASYDAYDLYLKGRYFWNKRNREGFQQAVGWFEQAINKDPNNAPAYAGLADCYAMMSGYGLVPAKEYMPKARSAALRALQIDDSLSEAHTSLAIIAQNYDWEWQTAEKEYRRAIELNPNYATAHHWYAESLAFQGRFEQALAESERARQLDPLSLIIAADNGAIHYFARDYDRAIERFRAVLDMDPGFTRAHLIIAAYVEKNQFKEALADIERWRRTAGDAPWMWAWEAYVYGRAGESLRAQHAMQKLQQLNRSWQLDPAQYFDLAYAGTKDKDKWLAWLDSASRDHSNVLIDVKVDPMYDPLRDDTRFQDLIRRVGLAR